MEIETLQFAIHTDDAILGFGPTPEDAWREYRFCVNHEDILPLEQINEVDPHDGSVVISRISDELLAVVDHLGGDIAWDEINRSTREQILVACDEE